MSKEDGDKSPYGWGWIKQDRGFPRLRIVGHVASWISTHIRSIIVDVPAASRFLVYSQHGQVSRPFVTEPGKRGAALIHGFHVGEIGMLIAVLPEDVVHQVGEGEFTRVGRCAGRALQCHGLVQPYIVEARFEHWKYLFLINHFGIVHEKSIGSVPSDRP